MTCCLFFPKEIGVYNMSFAPLIFFIYKQRHTQRPFLDGLGAWPGSSGPVAPCLIFFLLILFYMYFLKLFYILYFN